MPHTPSDIIPTKSGHLQGMLTLLNSGNQVTLTQIRTTFDHTHPGSAADHFELCGSGYKLTNRSGFVNLIGAYTFRAQQRFLVLHEPPMQTR
jgi:hypothetical protein